MSACRHFQGLHCPGIRPGLIQNFAMACLGIVQLSSVLALSWDFSGTGPGYVSDSSRNRAGHVDCFATKG
jgi:hypothetical protein